MNKTEHTQARVSIKFVNSQNIDPKLIKNGGSQKVTINGKKYKPDQIPKEIQSYVKQLQNGDYRLTEEVKEALDRSPQLRRVELIMYAIIQLFSLFEGLAIQQIIRQTEFSLKTALPNYLIFVISIVIGHLVYLLAKRNIKSTEKNNDLAKVGFILYFFKRFSRILIAFRAGWYATFFNLFIYGTIIAIFSN